MSVPTTANWDESTPAGSSYINTGDERIREMKAQVREIMEIDHDFPSSATATGYHKKVTLQEQANLGTGAVGTTILGSQTVSGRGELVYTNEDDTDIQLTSGAYMGSASTNIAANTIGAAALTASGNVDAGGIIGDNIKIDANNTYITSKNAAGSGTVNLIKANASDKPVLPDGAEMATSGAPTTDAGIANKKYVDDTAPALGSWASATSGTASTDILVCAYTNSGTGLTLVMTSGGTVRQRGGQATDQDFCGMMPVKSGDTWSVTGSSACYYIPLS